MTKRRFFCTDNASGGDGVTLEAASAQAALNEYIGNALRDPWSYNQGEDGVSQQIGALAIGEDDDTDRAEGVIDFSAVTAR